MLEAIFLGLFALVGFVVFPRILLNAVRNVREALAAQVEYRRPSPEDAKHVAGLDGQSERVAQLVALKFELLGDLLCVIKATGRVHVALRVLVDDRKTTCVFVAQVWGRGTLMFDSFSDTQELVTSHAPQDSYIETGPTTKRQFIPAHRPIGEAYRKHLELAKDATVTLSTLDDVVAAMSVSHDRLIAWRNTQSPDSLLDRDLDLMLSGSNRLFRRWAKKRIQTIPQATIRRG